MSEADQFKIERVDDSHFVIERDLLLHLALEGAVCAIPARRDGTRYRLGEVALGSLLARLGLQTGDLIETIGEQPPTRLLSLRNRYAEVRQRGFLRVKLVRAEAPITLHYAFKNALPKAAGYLLAGLGELSWQKFRSYEQALAVLARGVREVAPGRFEVDREVLRILAAEEEFLWYGLIRLGVGGLVTNGVPSVYSTMGLTQYDVLVAVTDVEVGDVFDIVRRFAGLAERNSFELSVKRALDPMTWHYTVVTGVLSRADVERALSVWRTDVEGVREVLSHGRAVGDEDERAQLLKHGITKVGDDKYAIKRIIVKLLAERPNTWLKGARLVPSVKQGKGNGFKLYAIRPESIFSRLGIRNGDTIHTINGHDVSTPDQVLAVYEQVKNASRFVLTVTRRGKPRILKYVVE